MVSSSSEYERIYQEFSTPHSSSYKVFPPEKSYDEYGISYDGSLPSKGKVPIGTTVRRQYMESERYYGSWWLFILIWNSIKHRDQILRVFASISILFLDLGGFRVLKSSMSPEIKMLSVFSSSLFLKVIFFSSTSLGPTTPMKLKDSIWAFLIFLSNLSPLESISTANPSRTSKFLICSAYSRWSLPMGIIFNCLGEIQKSHLPPVCSQRMAMNLSSEPKIALWMMTGLSKPFLTGWILLYPE